MFLNPHFYSLFAMYYRIYLNLNLAAQTPFLNFREAPVSIPISLYVATTSRSAPLMPMSIFFPIPALAHLFLRRTL